MSQCGAARGHIGFGISLILSLLVLCTLTGRAQAHAAERCASVVAQGLPRPPRLVPAGRNLWRVPAAEGESSPSNGGVVTQLVVYRDRARLWLVGSGPTPAFGAALACLIEAELGLPVTDVVNTRAHPELAMGNSAFPDARLWALPEVAGAMAAQCGTCMERLQARLGPAGASLDPALIRAPTQHVGGRGATRGILGPFRWWALPRAPGVGTLALQPRDQALLVAQGLVWVGGIPNLRDTDSATLLSSLQRLRAKVAQAQVIGEQGAIGGIGDVDSHIAYLGALRKVVRRHVEQGDDEAATLASITLPTFAQRSGYFEIHPLNVQRVWREFERALFR